MVVAGAVVGAKVATFKGVTMNTDKMNLCVKLILVILTTCVLIFGAACDPPKVKPVEKIEHDGGGGDGGGGGGGSGGSI